MNRRSDQANIYYAKTAQDYIQELSEILYEKQYFSYLDSSHGYVRSLILNMEATIHIKQKYEAPLLFKRYGTDLYYVFYPKNKRTTWYFFFTYHPEGGIYFIRHISNNHIAGHLL